MTMMSELASLHVAATRNTILEQRDCIQLRSVEGLTYAAKATVDNWAKTGESGWIPFVQGHSCTMNQLLGNQETLWGIAI